jgi:hypothetical protein
MKEGFCVCDKKVDRTSEFLKILTDVYENHTWDIKVDGKPKHWCMVLDKKTLMENKDKTLKEIFKLGE